MNLASELNWALIAPFLIIQLLLIIFSLIDLVKTPQHVDQKFSGL